jgi:hypothetical protein
MKIKVLNPQNQQIEEVEEGLIPQYVNQGFQVEANKEFNVESPDGKRGALSTADLKKALDSGFKIVTRDRIKQEELEEKYDNPIYGATTALARGLTMGLSDQALVRSQLLSKEELKAMKDASPISSIVGEVTGFIAPLLATGGASAAAQATAKIGALPRLVQKGAELAGKTAVDFVGKKATSEIAKKAIQAGVTGIVEGALQGVGQTISEDALGTADFNAESLLYNVGIGGAIGGALGAGIGAVGEASSRFIGKGAKEARKKLANSLDLPPEQKTSLINSIENNEALEDIITKLGSDKPRVEAFKNLGIDEVPEYITSNSPFAKTGRDFLTQSHTPAAMKMQAETQVLRDKVDDYAKSLVASSKEVTDTELGQFAKDQLKAEIAERQLNAKTFYESLAQYDTLTIDKSVKKTLIDKLKKSDAIRLNTAAGEVKGLIKSVDAIESIGDITKVRTDIGGKREAAKFSRNFSLTKTYDDLYQSLTTMREDAIVNSSLLDEGLKKSINQGRKIADKEYRGIFKDYELIDDVLGGRKSKTIDQMIEKIEDIDNGEVFNKLFRPKKIEQTIELSQRYPQIFGLIKEKRLNDIFNESFVKFKGETVFSPEKLVDKILKMKPEEQGLMFPGMNIKEIAKNIRLASESLPKRVNYSNTAEWGELRTQLTQLAMDASGISQLRDQKLYNALKNGDSYVNNYFMKTLPVLEKVEKAGNALKIAVDDTARDLLSNVRRSVTSAAISYKQPSQKEIEKARDDFQMLQNDPKKMMDDILRANKQLYVAAPKAYQALEQKISSAINLISEKMPKTDSDMFGDSREISRTEAQKIHEYIKGINNPKEVLKEISKGYINPYALSTFKIVYPDTFYKLTDSILTRLPSTKLTYSQKRKIEQLLGTASQASRRPEQRARIQANFLPAEQPQQPQQGKIRMVGADKLNSSGRTMTGLDSILSRQKS